MQEEQLEQIKVRLEEMQAEILGESEETVHGMQEESTLYPDPNDRASLETEHINNLRIRDRERKLLGKVEEAYSKGFSVVDGEHDLDIISIGSAILDMAGAPIAAIELVAPRKNLKWMKQRERIGAQLETAAREITKSLTHQ